MFVFTIGDLFGIILLIAVLAYIAYLFIWDKRDLYKKQKPYHKKDAKSSAKVGPAKSDPRVLRALAVIGLLFIIGIALVFLTVKK